MKRAGLLLSLVCAGLLLADLAYHKHGHYAEEEWFGFFPAVGFLACAALALAARVVGALIRRPADYYDAGARHDR